MIKSKIKIKSGLVGRAAFFRDLNLIIIRLRVRAPQMKYRIRGENANTQNKIMIKSKSKNGLVGRAAAPSRV